MNKDTTSYPQDCYLLQAHLRSPSLLSFVLILFQHIHLRDLEVTINMRTEMMKKMKKKMKKKRKYKKNL
jgi:hypothetical protein